MSEELRLIENWQELSTVDDSDTHRLEIEEHSGWIVSKEDEKHEEYLSTHTFYGHHVEYSNKLLQERGFNIQLKNWDEKNG